MRYRPEIIAQAAATVEMMMPGRFFLGVGTGENLNEHILGRHWPKIAYRREMLEEAVDIIRDLWTGELTSYHGEYFTVEDARIYSMPDDPPPIIVAAAGPHSAAAAGRFGDGLITTSPKKEIAQTFDQNGGKGKPRYCQMTMCWAKDMETAKKTAFKFWRTSTVPGPLHPYLALPSYFDAVSKQSTPDELPKHIPMGPDPATYVSSIKKHLEAGYDQISFHQVGHDQRGFFDFFSREVMPRVERELGGDQQRAASD